MKNKRTFCLEKNLEVFRILKVLNFDDDHLNKILLIDLTN